MTSHECSRKLHPGIQLQDMGSFHIGGSHIQIKDKPIKEIDVNPNSGRRIIVDPNGTYHVGQIYVQYYIPQNVLSRYPLLLWHGGGMTGKTYETTPDGRPGWLNYFVRCGWKTYLSDAVERGRSGWCPAAQMYEEPPTLFNHTYIFQRFRLGRSFQEKTLFENSRFPIHAFEEYSMEFVPRWTSTSDQTVDAYCKLLERLGPSVIVAHSQGATLAFEVMEKKPELVKALVAVEPYAAGTPERISQIRHIPILWIFGDYTDEVPAWKEAKETATAYCEEFCRHNGDGQVLELDRIGIRGNSHMMMMEYNNFEIADLIEDWLIDHRLTRSL